jgi:hypothetical protein
VVFWFANADMKNGLTSSWNHPPMPFEVAPLIRQLQLSSLHWFPRVSWSPSQVQPSSLADLNWRRKTWAPLPVQCASHGAYARSFNNIMGKYLDGEGQCWSDNGSRLTRSSFNASFFWAIFCFLAALLFPPPPAVSSTLMGLSLINVLLKKSAF